MGFLFIRSAPLVFPHETSPNQILLKTGRNAVRFALWAFETSFPPLLKTNIVVFPAIGHHFVTRCSREWNKSAHCVIRRKETAVNLKFGDVSWPSFQALLAPPIFLRSELLLTTGNTQLGRSPNPEPVWARWGAIWRRSVAAFHQPLQGSTAWVDVSLDISLPENLKCFCNTWRQTWN